MGFDRIYDKVAAPAAAGSDPVMAPDVLGFGDIYDRVKPVQAKKRTHGGAAGKFIGGGGDFGGTGASVKFGDSASEAEAKEIAAKVRLSPIDKWFDRTLRNKEPEKTKELYAKAGDFLTGSAADFSKGFYSTVDFILPDEIINQGDNWFSKFLDDAQQITQEKADKKNDIIAKQGPAGKAALKVTDNVLQAVPQVIAAILSGGTSTGAQAAAQLGTQGAGLAQTVIAYLKQLAKNPSFYLSLTQTLGESYEDAVADGAAEQEAVSTALISSLLNSAVEVGGGIEKIPGGKRSLRNWVKGMAEEGGEEVVQGVIDQLTRKAVYDPDKPLAGFDAKRVNRLLGTDIPQDVSNALLSTTGEDAVFDPVRAAQEFGLGAAVGGILGGGEMAVGKAVDTIKSRHANVVHGADADASALGRNAADDIIDSMVRAVYGYGEAGESDGAVRGKPVDLSSEAGQYRSNVIRQTGASLDSDIVNTVAKVAERTGRKIRFVKTLGNGIDGMYDAASNTLYVALDSGEPVYTVLKHELTHSLEGTQAYDELSSYILRTMGEQAEKRIAAKTEQYARAGETLSREQAIQELVADYAGENLFTSDDAIRRLAGDHPGLAQRILVWIRSMRTRLFGTPQEKMLARAERLYLAALAQPAAQRNGVQYKLEGYSERQKANWADSKSIVIYENQNQLEQFINDALERKVNGKKMYFGRIPDALAQRVYMDTGIGISNYNCSITAYEIQKILKDHGGEQTEALRGQRPITRIDIANIPLIIQDPDIIRLASNLYNGRPVIHFIKTIDGKTTVVAYTSQKHMDLTVQTMYAGKNNGNLAKPTDEQAPVNTPEANIGTVPINIISQDTDNVNSSISRSVPDDAQNRDSFLDEIMRDVMNKAGGKNAWSTDAGLMKSAEKIAARTGRKIRFVKTLGNGIDGMYDATANTLYVALDSGEPVYTVLKHELTHSLEGTQAYDELSSYILRTMGEQAEKRITAKTEQYARAGETLSREQAIRELVADYAGENLFTSDDAIRRLAGDHPGLAQRILVWIRSMRTRLFGTPQEKTLARAERLYLAALAQPAVQRDGVQYSIRYTDDNRPVVVVEENILEGIPKNEWVKKVKQTLKDKFSAGIPVSGRLVKVNSITKGEYTNSKYSRYLKSTDRAIYADKFKVGNNLDEIVLASTNYINEDLKHERNDKFKEFARGDVLIRVGGIDYSAKVIVGFTSGNQMVLYDVIAFTPADFNLKKEDSSIDLGKNRDLRNEPSSSVDTQFAAQSLNSKQSNSNVSTDTTILQSIDNVNSSISRSVPDDAQNRDSFLDEIMRDVMNRAGARTGNAAPAFGQEGEPYGRRAETREGFLGRIQKESDKAVSAGRPAVRTRQVGGALYAFLPVEEAAQSRQAREIRRILAEYGIPSDIVYGTQANAGGVTRRVQGEATALPDGSVLIKNDAALDKDGRALSSPKEIAAHEMTHEAKRIAPEEYQQYYDTVTDGNIDFSSKDCIDFTSSIIKYYFTDHGRTFDITTDYPALYNEVAAFIGGDLFDNEARARETYSPMFHDFDAVADAWRRMEAAVRAKAGAREEARAAEDTAAPQDFTGLLLRSVLG